MIQYMGRNEKGERVYYTSYLQAAANFAKKHGVTYKENYWLGYSYIIIL